MNPRKQVAPDCRDARSSPGRLAPPNDSWHQGLAAPGLILVPKVPNLPRSFLFFSGCVFIISGEICIKKIASDLHHYIAF